MPKSKPPQLPESQPTKSKASASKALGQNAAQAANAPELPAAATETPRASVASSTPLSTSAVSSVIAAAAVVVVGVSEAIVAPVAVSLADPAQQGVARAKYQALHDQISATRETLPGDDTTNRTLLRDRAEEAQDVLTTLDRNDLQANTPAFTAAASQIQQANTDMEKLSESIGGIIHNIQAVADFVQITNEAVSAAAKFIA